MRMDLYIRSEHPDVASAFYPIHSRHPRQQGIALSAAPTVSSRSEYKTLTDSISKIDGLRKQFVKRKRHRWEVLNLKSRLFAYYTWLCDRSQTKAHAVDGFIGERRQSGRIFRKKQRGDIGCKLDVCKKGYGRKDKAGKSRLFSLRILQQQNEGGA